MQAGVLLVRKMLLSEHMIYLYQHTINTVQGFSVCKHIICCVSYLKHERGVERQN